MAFRKPAGFLITALSLASALISGCGGSSSETTTIPTNASIFYAHSVAFRNSTSSTLHTWGYNAFGQLGDGTLERRASAAPVPDFVPVDRAAAGGNHTLALAFANVSSVYGWGWNRQGQIGPNPAPDSQAHSKTPVKIALGGVVREIAAGGVHSLAVVDVAGTTGAVKSWGINSSGELGNNTTADSPVPVFAVFSSTSRTDPLSGIVKLAAGSSHSLALTGAPTPGMVYSWGSNESKQLGRDTTSAGATPQVRAGLVQLSAGTDLTGVTQIAAGGSTSYALRGTNEVFYWGFNPTTKAEVITPTRIVIPGNPAIRKISAGWDHLLILTQSAEGGTVWGWGFNGKSQLGDGTIVNSDTPVQVRFSETQMMTGAIDIIAFGNHSLARLSDGVWYGWGENAHGQLGNPISSRITVPTRVQGSMNP